MDNFRRTVIDRFITVFETVEARCDIGLDCRFENIASENVVFRLTGIHDLCGLDVIYQFVAYVDIRDRNGVINTNRYHLAVADRVTLPITQGDEILISVDTISTIRDIAAL